MDTVENMVTRVTLCNFKSPEHLWLNTIRREWHRKHTFDHRPLVYHWWPLVTRHDYQYVIASNCKTNKTNLKEMCNIYLRFFSFTYTCRTHSNIDLNISVEGNRNSPFSELLWYFFLNHRIIYKLRRTLNVNWQHFQQFSSLPSLDTIFNVCIYIHMYMYMYKILI